jgi:adenylate cyclase
LERRLAAILVADVCGYSRLMENDEPGTLSALKERRQNILEPLLRKSRGRLVKVMGDSVLVEFASAVNAVSCAVEMQAGLAAANAHDPAHLPIVVRIGINLGDVMAEGGDVYGDGVNVASRLQALAEPGGIWIAGGVYDQVHNKVALQFEDLGQREMRNLTRPIRVFRVLGGARTTSAPAETPVPQSAPSIAVLPFTNMSMDPAQDCMADGITENIITNLSRFRDLLVIARHSTFAYKGKMVNVHEVSRELGARYVLEGSLQKAGERVRITAQLIDGATGLHLWTERYEPAVEDIFTAQDEVTEMIVGTLATGYGGRLRKAWRARSGKTSRRNFEAFDHFLRGIEHEDRFTKQDNRRARECFTKASRIDPRFGKAIAKIAWSHVFDALFDWSDDREKSWASALSFANLAVERDDDEAWGHWALGGYHLFRGQLDRAMPEYQRALELNPNDADVLADFALCLCYAGQSEKGLDLVHKAMRLNPHYPDWYMEALGHAYYDGSNYADAIATFETLRTVDTVLVHLYLAASHAALGHLSEARRAIARALEIDPRVTIERWANLEKAPYKDPKDLERLRADLRKAGLPELSHA